MDDGASPTTGLLVFAGLIILDFIVFGFSAAMQHINEASVEKLAKEENRQAQLLMTYMDKTERYTHVCQLLVLTAHMLLGFVQIPLWRRLVLPAAESALLSFLSYLAVFVVLILLVLVLGIYTPQKVASRRPSAWALRLVRPLRAVELVFYPLILCTDRLSNLLARIFGVDPLSDTGDVTEEEIISMVREGHEQGVLLASEAEMIHNIFEFGDKEAKDIMTHRKHIMALDGTMTVRQMLEFIRENNNYSRLPVYLGDIDNIIGILHIREALELSMDPSGWERPIHELDGIIRDVAFIPETRNINTLFTAMQAKKNHLVIVVDEYGQTAGLVAMEDILEEIVGNIEDEHDDEETKIERLTDGSYRMNGMAPFEEVAQELSIGLDEEADEFETLNGFLISRLGKIPGDDELFTVTAYGYEFEVCAVLNKSIQSVRVRRAKEDSGSAEDSGES